MAPPNKYYEYRAYDKDLKIHEGFEYAPDFPHLALNLRQRGLQVISATEIHRDRILAEKRLAALKASLTNPPL